MRTRITADNPFAADRYGFAWEHTPANGAAHLDVGCYEGAFLASLAAKGIPRLVGADASSQAVSQARQNHPQLEFHHVPSGQALPFPDATFSSVTLLDVLEHVADQRGLLGEIRRVLRPGGVLVVTVPGAHVFSGLDLGNLKFRFPRLHRWYYCRTHSRQEYRRRYEANPDGLVGDVEAAKGWHEHFSRRCLRALLESAGLQVRLMDGAGLFQRPLYVLSRPFGPRHPVRGVLKRLRWRDARWFASANTFCVAGAVGAAVGAVSGPAESTERRT